MIGSTFDLADADRQGRTSFGVWRKVPSQPSTAGGWVDLSMAAGFPVPNYYASTPLELATLDPWRGILHGDAVSPARKHLARAAALTITANMVGPYWILDYVGYYPFIDGDAVGERQDLINPSAAPLPRYQTGSGVKLMAVAVAPTTGGGTFTVEYDDADGTTRTSPVLSANAAVTNIASLLCGDPSIGGAPFLGLNNPSAGVRRVNAVTVLSPIGGLFALVCVAPLMKHQTREIQTPDECELIRQRPLLPRIHDGAYLNLILNCLGGSVAGGTHTGRLGVAWSA